MRIIAALVIMTPAITFQVAHGGAKKSKPVAVRAVAVKVVDFHDRVEALGTLLAKESVALTATVTDIVSAIKFDDGQRVEKDQVLVEMAAAEERAQLAEAQSMVSEAELQYKRTKGLAKRRLTAQTVLDERRRLLETSKARLRAMTARMADRVIRAPFAGVVGLRNISVGALVEPGKLIVDIADDSMMKLDFSVPSTFIGSLQLGLPVVATARGLGVEKFRGKITSVDNRIDKVTRTIRVRAVLPNPNRRLVPGMLMQIVLFKDQRQAMVIPEEAIVPVSRENFVFVVDQDAGNVSRRLIQTGKRRPGDVEVLDGLKVGELVVTHGHMKLRPGSRVTIDNKTFERVTPPSGGGIPAGAKAKTSPRANVKPVRGKYLGGMLQS